VLRSVRLTGAFFFDVQAGEPWVAETPRGESIVGAMFPGSEHLISYHLILEGGCWICLEDEPALRLVTGDIVVLPHGDTHTLSSAPGLRRTPEMQMYRRPDDRHLPVSIAVGDDVGNGARFVCGFVACDARPYNPLLSALPRMFRLGDHVSGSLGAYFQAALAETKDSRLGGAGILHRLSELMFVDAVRRYLKDCPPVTARGSPACAIHTSGGRSPRFIASPAAHGRSNRSPAKLRSPGRRSQSASAILSANRPCST